jgi:hypothetical protein
MHRSLQRILFIYLVFLYPFEFISLFISHFSISYVVTSFQAVYYVVMCLQILFCCCFLRHFQFSVYMISFVSSSLFHFFTSLSFSLYSRVFVSSVPSFCSISFLIGFLSDISYSVFFPIFFCFLL